MASAILSLAAGAVRRVVQEEARVKLIDCHNHVGMEFFTYFQNGFPYAQHLITMVEEGRGLGIDQFITFPFVSNAALGMAGMRAGRIDTVGAIEGVPYEFENRRLMDEIYNLFPAAGEYALPFAMLDPNRNVPGQEQALRALRAEYKFYGLKTQATIIQSPIKGLLDKGRVFLELCEEWDIPFLIHSSVLAADIWSQAHDIIDIAEKFPRVRFCVAHSCRFDRTALDRIAGLSNTWFDCSAHRIHCMLAVDESPTIAPPERRFKTDFTRPEVVLRDLAEAYPDKLMWGSDSPYYSYVATHDGVKWELISTYAEEVACVHALPEKLQRLVGEVNTSNFLKMTS